MTPQRLREIAHDLRSPIIRINLAVSLARTGEGVEEALAVIERESARLARMVDALGAGGDGLQNSLALDELLRAVAGDCEIEAKAKRCEVELTLCEASMRGDGEALRRAFENVLRNALRFAPEGSRVSVRLGAADGAWVVEIRDSGPGVPVGMLEKIFDPFFRLDEREGQGLGLAIAERVVEAHGGTIRAENASPGLRVSIELPVPRAE